MKRFAIILAVTLIGFIASCTRVEDGDIDPDALSKLAKCPLRSISSGTGAPVFSFEYTLGRIKRIVTRESGEVSSVFTYNLKNKIDKMVIEAGNSSDAYTVVFEYDAAGKIIKSKTSIKDYQFMTNEFTYDGEFITAVSTQFNIFGATAKGKTRVEYLGENVSKVYTQIDGYPELLTFEGVSYDNKPQYLPSGYRTMALGFIGIANNFFASLGKNNPTMVKIYDDNGKLNETTQTSYQYDKSGIVTNADQTMTNADNVKTTRKIAFEFVCL
ncbi:hypothetical protein [Emticicia agri]|uniref:DUF4595 domain-containing protein n=1 Tax=Emticicia agri TaxID=2492393 RepID=A0A4Q5LWR8_9BACT|nr:hypothetical protein [Emticicia agri]RYU94019.1 hypothetical protein EWM59_19270 [Emticicia agri]